MRHGSSTTLAFPRTVRILLLKRAADEVYFPNVFELPSGKVDSDDRSLRHALEREVKEETGLDIIDVICELEPMIYVTEKKVSDDMGQAVLVSKTAIQLNYVVSVAEGMMRLNETEHSESVWATEGMLDDLNITSVMNHVIQEAFRWASD